MVQKIKSPKDFRLWGFQEIKCLLFAYNNLFNRFGFALA